MGMPGELCTVQLGAVVGCVCLIMCTPVAWQKAMQIRDAVTVSHADMGSIAFVNMFNMPNCIQGYCRLHYSLL